MQVLIDKEERAVSLTNGNVGATVMDRFVFRCEVVKRTGDSGCVSAILCLSAMTNQPSETEGVIREMLIFRKSLGASGSLFTFMPRCPRLVHNPCGREVLYNGVSERVIEKAIG